MAAPSLLSISGTTGRNFALGQGRKGGKRPMNVRVPALSIAAAHVTLQQWRALRDSISGYVIPEGVGAGLQHPVTGVSWLDAAAWLNALSEDNGLKPAYAMGGEVYRGGVITAPPVLVPDADGFRLPGEQAWEYCAREGARPGDEVAGAHDGKQPSDVANLESNYPFERVRKVVNGKEVGKARRVWSAGAPVILPVGSKQANAYGVFDMSGNVAEWTGTPCANPSAEYDEQKQDWRYRIVRGGAVVGPLVNQLPADREVCRIDFRLPSIGFRIAIQDPDAEPFEIVRRFR